MRKKNFRKKQYRARKYKSLILAFMVILFVFIAYFTSQYEPVKKKYVYPFPYQELITLYSESNGISPALVASVIMHESKFSDQAYSPRGAIGLMQIMPDTAEWIASTLSDSTFSEDKLREPEMNIRYGTWYLSLLLREFEGNVVLALAAYNAGRGTVHEWMEENDWPEDFNDVSSIPYPETRHYVERVLKDWKQYSKLYHPKEK